MNFDAEGMFNGRIRVPFPWLIRRGAPPDGVTLEETQVAFRVRRGYFVAGVKLDIETDIHPDNDRLSEQPLAIILSPDDLATVGKRAMHVWAEVQLELAGDLGVTVTAATLKHGRDPKANGWTWYPSQGDFENTGLGFAYIGGIGRVANTKKTAAARALNPSAPIVYDLVPKNAVRQHLRAIAPLSHLCHEIAPVRHHLEWTGADIERRSLLFVDANSKLLKPEDYLYA